MRWLVAVAGLALGLQAQEDLSARAITAVMPGLKGQGPLPVALVVASHGHEIRRIPGDPFVWRWVFLPGDQEIAYETGPLHGAMNCVRMEIASGKVMARVDCFEERADAPEWVRALKAQAR